MNPDEDNRVKEDSPVVLPTLTIPTTINATSTTIAGGADLNPCTGNATHYTATWCWPLLFWCVDFFKLRSLEVHGKKIVNKKPSIKQNNLE